MIINTRPYSIVAASKQTDIPTQIPYNSLSKEKGAKKIVRKARKL